MNVKTAMTSLPQRAVDLLETDSSTIKFLLVITCAYLTAVSAYVRIPLWFTPVPITGQVFAVLLIGGLLRGRLSCASQAMYIAVGLCGLPWYAGGGAGYHALIGVSGGYLIGFVLAAPVISVLLRMEWFRRSVYRVALAMCGGLSVIYLLGSIQFAVVSGSSWYQTLELAVAPFIVLDTAKLAVAATIVYPVMRRRQVVR